MSAVRLAMVLLLADSAAAAAKDKTASFINGTYAMEGRCEKWAAIQNGGPKSVETVPETLTAAGFESWEGGCEFLSIKEKVKGRKWTARMECWDAAEHTFETDTFELDPKSGNIKVTTDGKPSVFVRCDEGKGK